MRGCLTYVGSRCGLKGLSQLLSPAQRLTHSHTFTSRALVACFQDSKKSNLHETRAFHHPSVKKANEQAILRTAFTPALLKSSGTWVTMPTWKRSVRPHFVKARRRQRRHGQLTEELFSTLMPAASCCLFLAKNDPVRAVDCTTRGLET